MDDRPLLFRVHAVQRMFERGISETDVRTVLEHGELIEPDSLQAAGESKISLGWVDRRPLHVVHTSTDSPPTIIVITVYEPDERLWRPGFRERR